MISLIRIFDAIKVSLMISTNMTHISRIQLYLITCRYYYKYGWIGWYISHKYWYHCYYVKIPVNEFMTYWYNLNWWYLEYVVYVKYQQFNSCISISSITDISHYPAPINDEIIIKFIKGIIFNDIISWFNDIIEYLLISLNT